MYQKTRRLGGGEGGQREGWGIWSFPLPPNLRPPTRFRVVFITFENAQFFVQGGAEGREERKEQVSSRDPQRPQPPPGHPPQVSDVSRPPLAFSPPRSPLGVFGFLRGGSRGRSQQAPGLGRGEPAARRSLPASPGLVSAGAAARASPGAPSSARSPVARALPAALSTLYLLPRHVAPETRLDFGSGCVGARIVQRDV